MGVKEVAGKSLPATLQEQLYTKQLLLVLDNFEQIIPAAPLVSQLLRACPLLKMLVTSREVLRLRGEQEFLVPLLALPNLTQTLSAEATAKFSAVELFVQRAQAIKADFMLDASNAAAIAELCVRLDGLPLALELAAARMKVLSPQGILTKLADRFKLLRGGARDLPDRQRTLQATMDWSYDLLTADEQTLFRRLAVFVGGYTLEAVEEVCNPIDDESVPPLQMDVLDGLTSLVDKSLIYQTTGLEGEQRFMLLMTIHEYAAAQLTESGEVTALRQRHAAYYQQMAQEAERHLWGAEIARAVNRLETEHANLRTALHYYLTHPAGAEAALWMSGLLWRFWEICSHVTEGRAWLEKALAQRHLVSPNRYWIALHGAGNLALDQDEYGVAQNYYTESLALLRTLGNQRGIANSLVNLGNVALLQGECDQAITLTEEALAINIKINNKIGIAISLNNLADMFIRQSHYDRAKALNNESFTVYYELGDERGIAWTLQRSGTIVRYQGEYQQAARYYQESLQILQKLNNQIDKIGLLLELGRLASDQGDNEQAELHHRESLALAHKAGDRKAEADSCHGLAILAHRRGDVEQAVDFCDQSITLQREIGDRYGLAESLHTRGRIAQDQGKLAIAQLSYQKSLVLQQQLQERRGIAVALEALGALALAEDQTEDQLEQAARLFGAAQALREIINAPLSPATRFAHAQRVNNVHIQLGEEAFARAWASGQAMTLEQAIALALEQTLYRCEIKVV